MQKFMLEASVADLTGRKADATDSLEAFNGRLMLSALTDSLYIKKTNLAIDESRLADIEKREAEIAKAKKDLEERKKDVVSIDQDLTKLAVVKDAFGPKGIKTVVIDFLMPRLEEEVNNVLSRLSEFTVRFDTQAPKTDGGVKEGLFITIVNDIGEELPFESFSGGEKLKITVAISEALASLQKAKFRLFDEMFIGLDETSTESFAMVLERLQEDFPQVLCISHLRQIKDMFTRSIVVTKHNGISSIRV
jgi:exonuclease SbcC